MDVQGAGKPIPEEAPPGYFEKDKVNIEGIGEPATACFFSLSEVNPKDW